MCPNLHGCCLHVADDPCVGTGNAKDCNIHPSGVSNQSFIHIHIHMHYSHPTRVLTKRTKNDLVYAWVTFKSQRIQITGVCSTAPCRQVC